MGFLLPRDAERAVIQIRTLHCRLARGPNDRRSTPSSYSASKIRDRNNRHQQSRTQRVNGKRDHPARPTAIYGSARNDCCVPSTPCRPTLRRDAERALIQIRASSRRGATMVCGRTDAPLPPRPRGRAAHSSSTTRVLTYGGGTATGDAHRRRSAPPDTPLNFAATSDAIYRGSEIDPTRRVWSQIRMPRWVWLGPRNTEGVRCLTRRECFAFSEFWRWVWRALLLGACAPHGWSCTLLS